ncbi:pilus assembly protein [Sphingomonas sp. HHU CXW]|uniref:Pilus assembly protein n=1 Tax=Sphingomonas hominis TaxID=2741495 RepID=A0ABX2JLZ8_9SPHN|nr:pilus assembly protein [Sphingomonas hominis]
MIAYSRTIGERVRSWLGTLASAERGVSALEFALVAPLFLFIVVGGLELGYTSYVKAMLEGEMQRVGRSRTMETASSDEQRAFLQKRVVDAVHTLAPNAEVTFSRKVYRDYTGAMTGKEPFKDANGNGICDAKEVYEDLNNNGVWGDAGIEGSDGGARDIVVFTASIDYERLLSANLLGWTRSAKLQAKTALRNQPFDQQATRPERTCR